MMKFFNDNYTLRLHMVRSCALLLLIAMYTSACKNAEVSKPAWPTITQETKPWSRWWWEGSALTKEGITAEMETYKKAGLGGLEITPIYGVYGYEKQFVDFLSPQWMELFMHTLKEAERLDMGIDMATGTGWPFGGPWVTDEDACKDMEYRVYELKGGESLQTKIEMIQEPYLRAVGNQVHEVQDQPSTENTIGKSTIREPALRVDQKKIDIKDLVQPIAANKNLQALALDQVKFERLLPLQVLMAYSEKGDIVDLTTKVDRDGILHWVAPAGNWKLYAVFEGWHGKMVERAGPGGEGNVIDHFSSIALQNYLHRFDSAFKGKDIKSLRSFFNDSYEVDDARGAADYTPLLFEEFKKRRGYDLKDHLPALFGKDDDEKNKRILCDYRETISELVLNNFTLRWKEWAHRNNALIRNQAHGSPSNILDLYAAVDIPEIEGIEPLRIKMASSAGNVTGKKLVSSESATWLNEHFESNLSDIKVAVDRFLLNGVNHIVYHGTCYSPQNEPWPGWLFYAAVHMNPRNTLWDDSHVLNTYIARCQSRLQNSTADNDILVYFPIYDRFSTPGKEMIEHFDGVGKQFENTPFRASAEYMHEKGYAFDFISDKQIENSVVEKQMIRTEGNGVYKTILIAQCEYIPLKTMEKIIALAKAGATVIAYKGLPSSTAGFAQHDENEKKFHQLIDEWKVTESSQGVREMKVGEGRVVIGGDLNQLLMFTKVRRESIVDQGLHYIRKKGTDNNIEYFISNNTDTAYQGWVLIQTPLEDVVVLDPMSGEIGKGKLKRENGESKVYIQLAPRQSIFLKLYDQAINILPFNFWKAAGNSIPLTGTWKVNFTKGGPALPVAVKTDTLKSWTLFSGNDYQAFSGTATYTLEFEKPNVQATQWQLDLGSVKETASVTLNGKYIGTLIGPVYSVVIDPAILQDKNILEVKVSNLMANRIADMDKLKVFWRKFYNVNFPAKKAENRVNGIFSAAHWEPHQSGLLGPVKLQPLAGF
ncbi:glycosyl hydrolase [Ohtaekwangia koreensis]|nr:glycosyl hydrolase [Ohtaekwangia koreensis]